MHFISNLFYNKSLVQKIFNKILCTDFFPLYPVDLLKTILHSRSKTVTRCTQVYCLTPFKSRLFCGKQAFFGTLFQKVTFYLFLYFVPATILPESKRFFSLFLHVFFFLWRKKLQKKKGHTQKFEKKLPSSSVRTGKQCIFQYSQKKNKPPFFFWLSNQPKFRKENTFFSTIYFEETKFPETNCRKKSWKQKKSVPWNSFSKCVGKKKIYFLIDKKYVFFLTTHSKKKHSTNELKKMKVKIFKIVGQN